MSVWYKVDDEEDVSVSDDGGMLQVLFDGDYNGNIWVEIPIEFVKKSLSDELVKLRKKKLEKPNIFKT